MIKSPSTAFKTINNTTEVFQKLSHLKEESKIDNTEKNFFLKRDYSVFCGETPNLSSIQNTEINSRIYMRKVRFYKRSEDFYGIRLEKV